MEASVVPVDSPWVLPDSGFSLPLVSIKMDFSLVLSDDVVL